jgi:Zn-dependent peptidase ImmA (M78 family)
MTVDLNKVVRKSPKQRKNGWTEQEEEFLRQRYSSETGDYIAEIANRLGRTRKAILVRARKLKLYLHPVKGWTPDEEQFLKKNFRTMAYKEIGKRLGRSKDSVLRKLHAGLKLKRYSQHRWTAQELRLFKRLYGKITKAELARRFGVTETAVHGCAFRYGLLRSKKYTQSEKKFIQKNYFTMSNAEIAKYLNRPTASIGVMGRKLGVAGTPVKRAFGREVFRKTMKERTQVMKIKRVQ